MQAASKPEYVRALQTTIELTTNKKVNAKNAFSVDLDCLNNIQEFMKAQNIDKKWINTGEAIGAGAQVYGFRVDNVHSETYRMLSGITRNVRSGEQEIVLEGVHDRDEDVRDSAHDSTEDNKKRRQKVKMSTNPEKTLEKESNINLTSFDTSHEVDPLFK